VACIPTGSAPSSAAGSQPLTAPGSVAPAPGSVAPAPGSARGSAVAPAPGSARGSAVAPTFAALGVPAVATVAAAVAPALATAAAATKAQSVAPVQTSGTLPLSESVPVGPTGNQRAKVRDWVVDLRDAVAGKFRPTYGVNYITFTTNASGVKEYTLKATLVGPNKNVKDIPAKSAVVTFSA